MQEERRKIKERKVMIRSGSGGDQKRERGWAQIVIGPEMKDWNGTRKRRKGQRQLPGSDNEWKGSGGLKVEGEEGVRSGV